MRHAALVALCLLGGCAAEGGGGTVVIPARAAHVPPFAAVPYEPIHRAAIVAIAQREWRLFGSPVDDDPPGPRPTFDKPERDEGLWQRVGEYWFAAMPPESVEVGWTGKHDGRGVEFSARRDGFYAWSAAFISYVMRIAGAGDAFPYSATHADYINAAASGRAPLLIAHAPRDYAPRPGDVICMGRDGAEAITLATLTGRRFPGHCDIVVAGEPGQLSVIGGNVDDAVTMKHVPVSPNGRLADDDGRVLDQRWPWFVALEVRSGD